MSDLLEVVAGTVAFGGQTSSAQAWFADGERVGTKWSAFRSAFFSFLEFPPRFRKYTK
jgi:hypothetical protein